MDKNSIISIRDLVNDNTTFAVANGGFDSSGPGDIYYEPFIEDGKVGFYVRDHHGREDCVYLEPCTNDAAVWVHTGELGDEDRTPTTWINLCEDWPEEGWQVTLNGDPQGAVHTTPNEAESHAAGLRSIHPNHDVDIVSAPFAKE